MKAVTAKGNVKDVSFADDAAIAAAGKRNTEVFNQFNGASESFGLQVSLTNIAPNVGKDGKTEAMRITHGDVGWRPREGEQDVSCGPARIPLVESFIHLGMLRSTKNDLGIKQDIERRMRKGTTVMGTLEGVWRNQKFSRQTKAKMMTSPC